MHFPVKCGKIVSNVMMNISAINVSIELKLSGIVLDVCPTQSG